MPTLKPFSLRLEFSSSVRMVELVESITHDVGRAVGLDADGVYWAGLAVRESVINAVHHGNRNERSKRVIVHFSTALGPPPSVTISVQDEGEGFDPNAVEDPLAAGNLLSTSGRGMLMIRSFMDDVHIGRVEGGMEIRMTKRAPATTPAEPGDW